MAHSLSDRSGSVPQEGQFGALVVLACAALSAAGCAYVLLGGDAWLQARLPANLAQPSLWGVPRWRLLLSPVVLLMAWAVGYLLSRLSRGVLLRLALRTDNRWDEALVARIGAPLTLFWLLLSMYLLLPWMELAGIFHSWAHRISRSGFLLALFWGLSRSLDVAGHAISESGWARLHAGTLSLVPLAARIAKVAIWVLGVVALLSELGYPIASLIAGLGIGGLAVALAAQKTVENLFGGVSLIVDQPVRVGDFCRFGDKVGTVEDVGMRTTRVRTLDRTVVSIPNAEFAHMQLENFALRDKIRFFTKLGLRYETTADQLRWVLAELKRLLVAHPKIEPDPARIRFIGYGDYSLDLEIFAYVRTPDFNEYLAIQEDLLLRIMDIVDESGTGFAFPSTTTYFARDGGKDRARTEAAEARVRALREAGRLPFPDDAPERIAEIEDSIEYPPKGSALAGR